MGENLGAPETSGTLQHYGIEGFTGGPQMGSHYVDVIFYSLVKEHTQRNIIKSNPNQIVFTISRLIYHQTAFHFMPKQWKKYNYNPN